VNQLKYKTVDTDKAIVEQLLQKSKPELFATLYNRYAQKVFNRTISIIKNNAAAADVVQEVFIKVYLNLTTYKARAAFSTWVYSITYNECMNYLRNSKKNLIFDELKYKHDYADYISENDELENKFDELDNETLAEYLNHLNPIDKMLLLMKYQDSMAIKQIEQVVSLTQSAIKMRLKRAKIRIVELFLKSKKID